MKSQKILLFTLLYSFNLSMIFALFLNIKQQGGSNLFFPMITWGAILLTVIWLTKYVVYMSLCPWYEFKVSHTKQQLRHRQMQQQDYSPLVSVLIPAWNEEVGLVATVKTVLASTYRPLEIVIVNDGSTDKSDQMMRAFIDKYDRVMKGVPQYVPMLYYYQQNGGKGSALNTAIRLARGDILMTMDADCVVHEECVTQFVSCFTDPAVMAAAGNIKIGNTRSIVGMIQSLEYIFGFHLKKAEALLGAVFIIGGAASAFRKEVFARLGGYDVRTITEDLDLSLRIQEAGMKIAYVPEAIVHTEGPADLRGLLKQRTRWKRGSIEALSVHRSSFFRSDKGLNKLFFWGILPFVVVEYAGLVLAAILIVLLYLYSFLFHDFTMLLVTVLMMAVTFCVQFSEDKDYRKPSYFLLTPIIWYLFHMTLLIEVIALSTALWTFYRKREVKWQQWQRKGVVDFEKGSAMLRPAGRTSRSKVFALIMALLLIVTVPLAVLYVQEQSSLRQQPAHTISAQATAVYNGIYVQESPGDLTALEAFEHEVNKKSAIVMLFQGWGSTDGEQNFQTTWMDNVRNHGSLPLITWEPWKPLPYPQAVNQPAYTLQNIINGHFDNYISKWARDSKAWNHPYFLRFAPEMNGDWIPWAEQVNDNKQGEFVQAWRHVHDIFTANGVHNVTWVWCPNIYVADSPPLRELYPGDAYVDWVGMDGYNWGATPKHQWRTFSQVFKPTYDEILSITSKPMIVAETGSAEQGGSKANWITDAYTVEIPYLFPKIKAIIWFNEKVQRDWRIESSPSAESAFAKAIQSNFYLSNSFSSYQ